MTRSVAASLLAAILGVAVVAVGVAVAWAYRATEQPIAFNHLLHLEEVGMACTDCHLYATSGLRATIPNVEVCGGCHVEALTESPDEESLVAHVTEETPIPWRRVYWVPDHVFFSHRRHTSVAGIECVTCHGDVAQREEPLSRPLVALTMDDCTGCHARTGAPNDCILCHL